MKAFDWAEFLRLDSFLALQDEATRQWLVSDQASSERTYEPGDSIIREGEVGDSIFVIGSGSAEVLLSVNGAPEILLAVLRRGETFGEMGFFERRPRSATVRAREACVVLEVDGKALRSLADAHPEIGFRLLLLVSERLRRNNERILTLHLKGVEGANRAKDEFVAMLGHELRNPLGAIATAIHVLDARGGPDDTSASLRGIIVRQTHHLSRLVEDLLDVSKLVSGKIVLTTMQPEYLRDVVMRALTSFHEAGKASRHVISVTGAGVRVQADATRLQQVVTNLLDNAVKYTPSGGRVDMTVASEGPDAVLTVRDTGVGIRPEVLPRIFDLFVQASDTMARSAGGLGPWPDDRQAAGGASRRFGVSLEPGPNQGSEFVVRLPRIRRRAGGGAAHRRRSGGVPCSPHPGHRGQHRFPRRNPAVARVVGPPGRGSIERGARTRTPCGASAPRSSSSTWVFRVSTATRWRGLCAGAGGRGTPAGRHHRVRSRRATGARPEARIDAHLTKPVSPPELAAILALEEWVTRSTPRAPRERWYPPEQSPRAAGCSQREAPNGGPSRADSRP